MGQDATQVALDAGYSSMSGFREAFQKWFGATPGRVGQQRMLLVSRIFTPLGPLVVAADDEHLYLLEFADRRMLQTQIARLAKRLDCSFCPGENQMIPQTNREVSEYFSGLRHGVYAASANAGYGISTGRVATTAGHSVWTYQPLRGAGRSCGKPRRSGPWVALTVIIVWRLLFRAIAWYGPTAVCVAMAAEFDVRNGC